MLMLLATEAEHFKVDVKHQLIFSVKVGFCKGMFTFDLNKNIFTSFPHVIIA